MASDDIIRLPVAMTCYRCHRCLFYPPTLSVVLKDWPSETLLPLQTSAQRTLYVYHKRLRPLSSISRHRWKWLKFWVFFICIFWLRWGDWNMKIFFFFQGCQSERLEINLWKSYSCFLLSLSRADHIDQSWKLQTEKKMNECSVFHCVLWLHTLIIPWVSFVIVPFL